MTNPYRHLLTKAKALLIAENKLSIEEKKSNEWILSIKFHGTKVVVGKGAIATCFYQFGDGKRGVCYPDEICEKLERMGKRRHWLYRVDIPGQEPVFTFFEKGALKHDPVLKATITGLGESEELLYVAKRDVNGTQWIEAKKAKAK